MSVARTSAPSRAMAIAVARPMPCAAAVTSTRLPASRPAISAPPSAAVPACQAHARRSASGAASESARSAGGWLGLDARVARCYAFARRPLMADAGTKVDAGPACPMPSSKTMPRSSARCSATPRSSRSITSWSPIGSPTSDWRRADALIVYYGVPIDRALIERLDSCRILVRAGVGYDHIDIAACGGPRHPGVQRAGLRHDRGRRPRDRADARARPRPGLLPRPPARRSACRLALVGRAAGAPAARRHLRHRRHGPDRHRGEPPGAGPGHGGLLLRSVPARRHGARARLSPGRQPCRRCSPSPTWSASIVR